METNKNEEIAADIISFIRQAALGEALVDHESRIKQAMQKYIHFIIGRQGRKSG